MSNTKTHPLLTDEAMQACAVKARRALCDAGDMLLSMHGRALRRFHGELSEEAKQAIAELNVLANYMITVLARFDRAESNLNEALAQDG